MMENRYGRGQRSLSTRDKGQEYSGKKITLSLYDLPGRRYGDSFYEFMSRPQILLGDISLPIDLMTIK
jgi:hypothetical protein